MLLLSTAATIPARAEPGRLDGLQQLVDAHMKSTMAAEGIPGSSATVVTPDKVLINKGYGVTDTERKTPVNPEQTPFLVGSEAKLFTAQAVLQLVQTGRLDLDVDVNDYLRTFKIRETYPGSPVTLRHLLTHTAGFDEDHLVGFTRQQETLADGLARYQPERVRPPGSGVVYSNYAVALAGYLVEIASGVPYADYVERHVLRPLSMTNTTALCGGLTDNRQHLSDGSVTTEDCSYSTPTGIGPTSTPLDMAKYVQAQLSEDTRLGPGIAAEMQRQQYTEHPRLTGVGYIFEHLEYKGHSLLFKGGDMPGMHAYLLLVPDLGIGVNVMSNGDGSGGDGIDGIELVEKIVDRYLPERSPKHPETVPGLSSKAYEGWYQAGRTSRHSVIKIKALGKAPVRVSANADGTIHTTGLSGEPKDWDQIDRGVFAERDGWGLIAFPEPGQLAISTSTNVYDKITPLQHPAVHLAALGFSLLTMLGGLVGLPLAAIARRRRDHTPYARGARLATRIAWVSAVVAAGFTLGLVWMLADQSITLAMVAAGSPGLIATLSLGTLMVPLTGAMIIGCVAGWVRSWWTKLGLTVYTLLALGAVTFVFVAMTYNLVIPPFS